MCGKELGRRLLWLVTRYLNFWASYSKHLVQKAYIHCQRLVFLDDTYRTMFSKTSSIAQSIMSTLWNLKQTIQYSLKEQDIQELEQDVIQYVKEYERYICFAFVSKLLCQDNSFHCSIITSSQLTAFPPAPSPYMHLSISQMTFETMVHPVTIGTRKSVCV